MKKFFIISGICAVFAACGDGGTGDRTHNLETVTDSTLTPETNVTDTTPTTNNNIYNPDSAAGQGTAYDSSSSGKGPQ